MTTFKDDDHSFSTAEKFNALKHRENLINDSNSNFENIEKLLIMLKFKCLDISTMYKIVKE